MANTLLSSCGYQVFVCAGISLPVDLIAWKERSHPLLVRTKRSRVRINGPAEVAERYWEDLSAIRSLKLPLFANVQLWIWTSPDGWLFFDVMQGGIMPGTLHEEVDNG
jgi:hypothetical protein